jgi:hypothetical protein
VLDIPRNYPPCTHKSRGHCGQALDMKNTRRKGTRNEHRAIRILEPAAYCCTRAAASLGLLARIAIGRHSYLSR